MQKRGSKTFGPRKTAKKSKGGQYAGDHCEGKKAELEEAQKAVDECEEEHKAKEDAPETAAEAEDMGPEKTEEGVMDMNAGKKKKSKKH